MNNNKKKLSLYCYKNYFQGTVPNRRPKEGEMNDNERGNEREQNEERNEKGYDARNGTKSSLISPPDPPVPWHDSDPVPNEQLLFCP